jgi:pSer/pThr/pTyr-binding forkhead associated (FHA) protein
MPKVIELHFIEGENSGVKLRVSADQEVVIGRGEKCDVCLTEKKISRRHTRVYQEKGSFLVADLGSTNGTFVNDRKVKEPTPLSSGDRLRIGTSVIHVLWKEAEAAAAKPRAEARPAAPAAEPSGESQSGLSIEMEAPSAASVGKAATDKLSPAERDVGRKPLSGNLVEMGLPELLQAMAANRRSGHLLLNGPAKGEILVRDGAVAGARVGKVLGEKALYRILGWSEADFEFVSYPPADVRPNEGEKLDRGLDALLLEGYRQIDESNKLRDKLPAKNARLKLNPEMPGKLSKLHPRVLDLLQVLIRVGKLQEIFDESLLTDLDCAKIVAYLLKKGYVVAA